MSKLRSKLLFTGKISKIFLMTGKEFLAWILKSAGLKFCVFAQPELEPELASVFQENHLDFLTPITETASTQIADGYARASGKLGLVLAERDFEKLITGTTSAWADKTPMVLVFLVRGQKPGTYSHPDSGEVDFKRIFQPITRFQARVRALEKLAEVFIQAFRRAVSWQGGPVLVEVEEQVLEREITPSEQKLKEWEQRLKKSAQPLKAEADEELVEQAFELLAGAQRPLIFSGGGVIRSGASFELNQLAQKMEIPIVSSMGGMGSALPDNPVYLGPPSYLSGEAFHLAIKEADVVLAVGCVFSGLDGFGLPPLWSDKIKFIQVNIDPGHIGYNPPAELSLLGDARLIVQQLLARAEGYSPPSSRKEWVAKLQRLNQEHRQRTIDEASREWEKIHPATLVLELKKLLQEVPDFYAVLDGGNVCLWAGMLIDLPGPRRGFFPTGMGTLGSGLPMAIGVKKAVGDAPVFIISGDGSFLYSIAEFESLLKYQLPIKIVIFNDFAWNMIRAGQVSYGNEPVGTELPSVDYGEVAKSYGCFGAKVKTKEEIERALRQGLESPLPAVIDVEIDPDSIPDCLLSFGLVEFEGAEMSNWGVLKAILTGKRKLDIRLWNQFKYVGRSLLNV